MFCETHDSVSPWVQTHPPRKIDKGLRQAAPAAVSCCFSEFLNGSLITW